MQLPASDQALIQLLLDSEQYSLNSLARELDIHRNTLVRILHGTCQATHRTSSRLLAFYVAKQIHPENPCA
ncbi:MAG: hypothetical protein K0R12_959 [Gammaproteobacteria bacterium]|nr:hypothetical protein [Gammaproteobacteria bacterium]